MSMGHTNQVYSKFKKYNAVPGSQFSDILFIHTWSSSIFSVNFDICAVWDFETLRWWLQMIATCYGKHKSWQLKYEILKY